MIETIRNYISKDPVSYIHITELLDRKYTIVYAGEHGFIIHDDDVDFTYISFDDEKTMKEVLSNKQYEHYLAYDKMIVDYYNDEGKTTNLSQWLYPSRELLEVGDYDIRVLGLEYLPFINSFYKALGPDEDNKNALLNKEVLGLFEGDKLAGIVGRHPEGCMGMMKVFDGYQRKGYGTALTKAKINDLLKRNQRVFDEIIDGNDVSVAFHKRLGFIKGEKTIYWKL